MRHTGIRITNRTPNQTANARIHTEIYVHSVHSVRQRFRYCVPCIELSVTDIIPHAFTEINCVLSTCECFRFMGAIKLISQFIYHICSVGWIGCDHWTMCVSYDDVSDVQADVQRKRGGNDYNRFTYAHAL